MPPLTPLCGDQEAKQRWAFVGDGQRTSWLSRPANKANFLHRFAPDATLKPWTYSLVVQFVPLQFRPDSEPKLCVVFPQLDSAQLKLEELWLRLNSDL